VKAIHNFVRTGNKHSGDRCPTLPNVPDEITRIHTGFFLFVFLFFTMLISISYKNHNMSGHMNADWTYIHSHPQPYNYSSPSWLF